MKRINRLKKVPKKIGIPLAVLFALLVVYFGISIFFINHFYLTSKINGISVAGKTVEGAEKQMDSKLQTYTLQLKERNGKSEQIKASDIDLKYNSDQQFENLKDEQNPLEWAVSVFNSNSSKMTAKISYDEEQLKKQIDNLSCFHEYEVTEPKNPSFNYVNNAFVIVKEVKGNKVDKDALYERVREAISNMETSIDLDAANCYINSSFNSKSPKVIETRDLLNKYVAAKINYTFGNRKETLDGSKINQWLKVDESLNVIFDEQKVKDYVKQLSSAYDTVGKTRSFHTTSGTTINIGYGSYGWKIDVDKEAQALEEEVKGAKNITKEPIYAQTAFSHDSNDIGNTYVEVDMARQHLWFYKNGSLVVQGDVVTGNVSANHATPSGVYKLEYKQRNTVLRGQGYNAPVSFWMPFNGGIGLHDASWRGAFGGQIFRTSGSHGCVNCPYDLARKIYENIDPGTPIVCFY